MQKSLSKYFSSLERWSRVINWEVTFQCVGGTRQFHICFLEHTARALLLWCLYFMVCAVNTMLASYYLLNCLKGQCIFVILNSPAEKSLLQQQLVVLSLKRRLAFLRGGSYNVFFLILFFDIWCLWFPLLTFIFHISWTARKTSFFPPSVSFKTADLELWSVDGCSTPGILFPSSRFSFISPVHGSRSFWPNDKFECAKGYMVGIRIILQGKISSAVKSVQFCKLRPI